MSKDKIYIISDLEGVAGVVSKDQLGPEGQEYEIARSYLTKEINAAIEACVESNIILWILLFLMDMAIQEVII